MDERLWKTLCPECGEPWGWEDIDTGEKCCLRCGTKVSDYDTSKPKSIHKAEESKDD